MYIYILCTYIYTWIHCLYTHMSNHFCIWIQWFVQSFLQECHAVDLDIQLSKLCSLYSSYAVGSLLIQMESSRVDSTDAAVSPGSTWSAGPPHLVYVYIYMYLHLDHPFSKNWHQNIQNDKIMFLPIQLPLPTFIVKCGWRATHRTCFNGAWVRNAPTRHLPTCCWWFRNPANHHLRCL